MSGELIYRRIGILVLLVVLQGCSYFTGQKPDLVSEEKPPGRTYSNAETRRMLIDRPQLLSGEYFRQRAAENREDEPAHVRSTGESGQKNAADHAGFSEGTEPFGLKVGVLLDEETRTDARERMVAGAAVQAVPGNIVLVKNLAMHEVLGATDCLERMDTECISGHLSIYPGVRMLLLIEALHLPQSSGEAVLQFQLIDTSLGYTYQVVEITDSLNVASESGLFVRDALDQAFSYAASKAEVMPAHCRVFSVKSDRVFINAGKLTGLEKGDKFVLTSKGETINAPTGLPVAWIPGPEEAMLEVDTLVGQDSADCRVIRGSTPRIGDYVLFESGD